MEQFRHRLNQPADPRQDFLELDAFLFAATSLKDFDPNTGQGELQWVRHRRKPRVAFNHMTMPLEPVEAWEFPANYPEPKLLPLRIDFVSERCVRLRLRSKIGAFNDSPSPMLCGPVPATAAWHKSETEQGWVFTGPAGKLELDKDPFRLQLKTTTGQSLLRTHTLADGKCMITGRPVPFSFVRRASDLTHSIAASFGLSPNEKIFGCGESFMRLDKRGQSVFLSTQDAHGSQTDEMYKPVPFYLSSRGYGVFSHGSAPMLFDFGQAYGDTQVLYSDDDAIDLFIFLGDAKQVLSEYTALTGRSPRPPLWSFGLWMSRITYASEQETREVSDKLSEHRIPCDVIHLDTGWFEKDWGCDYRFSQSRFRNAKQMIADLKEQGRRISLWQLPYFAPNNPLYTEIVARNLHVRGPGGELVSDDAVLDFTNPDTVNWYQEKLRGLLELGVAAIKVDFGEGAPYNGLYHSGRTGKFEHNLYPLLYNRAAAEVTRAVHGYALIWARSAWAGSQRYPLHWGGDAEASDGGMLGSLRAGLSFGLSGFTYWSHDVGGFFPATPRELYLRWLPFGIMSSHCRCHGLPPTEPWHFDDEFTDQFRACIELRYRLLPYIWAQATRCSELGHPLLRPLFFEFPNDPGCYEVEDQYLFGSDILVAPLFEQQSSRPVYLPNGQWIDLQTEKQYEGPGYVDLEHGEIPVVLLGRAGAILPTVEVAQSTEALDFSKVELWVLGAQAQASGLFCERDGAQAKPIKLAVSGDTMTVIEDPASGRVAWSIRRIGA